MKKGDWDLKSDAELAERFFDMCDAEGIVIDRRAAKKMCATDMHTESNKFFHLLRRRFPSPDWMHEVEE